MGPILHTNTHTIIPYIDKYVTKLDSLTRLIPSQPYPNTKEGV